MGGGILQIAANSASNSIFNDQNYTLFKIVYRKYTSFSIEDYILNLTSVSDFGKKIDVVIPKVGDLLTDMMLVIDLPEVSGEYIFNNQAEYINSLQNQYTFSTMTDIQQYNENLYKLKLGNKLQVYLVRISTSISQISPPHYTTVYQLMLPLLDTSMFLIYGKKQKYSLQSFLETNSQFFDNEYKLHTIQDLLYTPNPNVSNIDYINYSFQDKEFYFFINNLLNIKQINPNYEISYYDEWQDQYFTTVKKYILRRPEITALNTFIENMNTQISNSIQINNYVFNYENIFSISPLDYQYNIILPISYTTNFYLLFSQYENYQNNKNYLLDYTSSFFTIFSRNYILIKRDNSIIGACIINSIKDINPLNIILQPYRHIFTNKLIETYGNNLYMYYGFDINQLEPINYAKISHIKLNINNYHEFELDRSIEISVGSTILIGINFPNETPINSYNSLYGIFKINNIRRTLNGIDNNSITNYNTNITAIPIEIDQLYLTDTILMTSYNNSNTVTYYPTFNKQYESTYTNTYDIVNNVKQVIYTDVSISTINIVPIKSISETLIRDIIFAPDFVLNTSAVTDINNTIQTYLYDSYDVLFNYMKNIYYKTILKSNNNLDYLNNLYFKINYTQSNNLFSFIDGGSTTFTNIVNGTFRYQQFLIDNINKHVATDGQYIGQLNYINFVTTHIIDQYKILSDNYNNQWNASILDIRNNSSDIFIKIINYLQYNNQNVNGRKTILTFTTDPITFTKTNLLSLTINYYHKQVTKSTITDYTLISNIIPLNVITKIDSINNTISFDLTRFILAIEQSFNLQNIDFLNSYFTYSIIVDETSTLNIININTYLDNYSNDLIQIMNDTANITNQIYGNNVLLDYINTQHEVMFGNMKNYELSRQYIIRNGGSNYNVYQEDIIDLPTTQIPLLVNNTFIVKYNSEEYFPRFLYSKQIQIYQNIYQKVNELSQNYFVEPSYIYFVNNINYVRSDGYNYTNDAQGSIPYLDPNQIPLLIHPTEYSYNLLDKISIYNISISPPTFSFIQYLEELEEHTTDYLQSQYVENYWNSYFTKNGTNTTTTNAYFAALAGKDDGLLIYYIYKYTSELAAYYSDMYNLNLNLDGTYYQTIYQFSPNVLGTLLFQIYSAIMNTTNIPDEFDMYNTYNQIIQNQVDLSTIYSRYILLPEYQNINNVEFTTNVSNIISEITYIFQVVSRLCTKYKINLILTSELTLSNYPIIYKIHGSNQMVKILLASDQGESFNSTVVFPTGYSVDQYYKVFNLSIHYDYLKYLFFAGYGGILRDRQYTDKTLSSFYQKINNYLTPLITNIDFAFFYANQLGIYLPNMEGNIVQSYQAWIQRTNQPYFYYFNTLSLFYDMMYIYQNDEDDIGSGRSFISEYYTKNTTTTSYNNRPDILQGELVYSTRMAYGTRDNKNRLAGISMRYNLLDQRLYGIINNFNNVSAPTYDYENDPIQIMNLLTNLNTRFIDYQEFLVLFKNSMNITGSYINQTTKKYSDITTQFKVNSTNITDLDLFTGWNDYVLNYATNQNYIFSSIITGLSTAITQYNQLESDTLNFTSVGYELYNFMNNFYNINERNFGDILSLRYLCNTNYHYIIDDYNTIFSNLTYFTERDNLQSDINYRNDNYSLVSLDFLNITIDKITSVYQSDIAMFKELFKNILNYRQINVQNDSQLITDYNTVNDVTSVTFYDKFFKFSNNVDYHLIPQIYHDIYNIQNASHTVVFYLNYLYSYLSTKSAKPNINDYDNPDLPVSYYFVKYLSSGLDYFLGNFHQLKLDNTQFYPYKNVPSKANIYDSSGTLLTPDRSISFMYIFMLYKIQYRNYMYGTIEGAFTYNLITVDDNPVRQITGLNMFTDNLDINADLQAFDTIIDNAAFIGNIDHLQNITHPFFANKHMDNLLFIKDLLNDLTTVNDNETINVILPNNANYVEFLNDKIIVTNSFDTTGLIFGGYPYTLGMLSEYNYIGQLPAIIDNNGTPISTYVEGNVVLPALIYKIYYFLISECFILNQTELIGSSFQSTNISLGNILGQVLAIDWKKGLLNMIAEYLYLILKSKKIIYQNSIYEIKYYDLYSRLQLFTTTDRLNDIVDMYLNSLLNVKITTYTVNLLPISIYGASYEQFKIPNVFSLTTIKNNFNYSIYYQLIFALRQSIIGKYNNFEERVQFHNAYDYWLVNNIVLISDYSVIEFPENSNIKFLIKNVDKTNILNALNYYHNDNPESNYIKENVPVNLYTTIINYIITSTYNTIFPTNTNTGNNLATNIKYSKNGYNVVLTLNKVCFDEIITNTSPYYNVTINTGTKTISGTLIITNNILPDVPTNFNLVYSYMPFGYEYNFQSNEKELQYEQLLYNQDIFILQTMFQIFQNIQNIEQTLNLLKSLSLTDDQYNFMHFSIFIESYIYFNFTSNIDSAKKVSASVSPLTTSIGSTTLYNFVFINWSEFYGEYFYVYLGNNPTQINFLGSSKVVFANGVYQGSVLITFNATGKQYISVTNQLIDPIRPYGSSDVAINVATPITVSNVSDGSLDNTFAIVKIPRSIKITIFGWSSTSLVTQLYTFVSTQSDGTLLKNASGGLDADGPFNIETYQDPNSNVVKYRIDAILTFATPNIEYIYISDVQKQEDLAIATIFAVIPNLSHLNPITVVNDISPVSRNGTIDKNISFFTVPTQFTITLTNWNNNYRINELYVYFSATADGQNLGDDQDNLNIPLTNAPIAIINTNNAFKLSFTANFKTLGNHYIYLSYFRIDPITNPYNTPPINFILNPQIPVYINTIQITNVTGILNRYIAITSTLTNYTITLGNWLADYTNLYGISELYIYTRNVADPDIYSNYIPINNLPNMKYTIIPPNNINPPNNTSNYIINFSTQFNTISQQYVYLTLSPITSLNPYGSGTINIQISNPPGSLTVFNYIDVILPFNTNYITSNLITYTNNTIQILVNNYSSNYNIYKTTPNLLYLFLSTNSNPANIYNSANPIPLIFDNNNILTYGPIYTTSVNPVYIFVSDNIVYGNGLISYGAGLLTNIIGNVNGVVDIPRFLINGVNTRRILLTLTNWDSSYGSVNAISRLFVYLGLSINNSVVIFNNAAQSITQPNNYVVDFNSNVNIPSNTYNVYISDNQPTNPLRYVRQLLTNQIYVTNQIFISSLISSITPVPTFTSVTYSGVIGNWSSGYALFPTTLYLFAAQTINSSTPYLSIVTVDAFGNFSFSTTTTKYNFIKFALSDNSTYGSGYLETPTFNVTTVIGPVNATLILGRYSITEKSTDYSILLTNWDSTYNLSQLNVYFSLYNFGNQTISLISGSYYINFTATLNNIPSNNYTLSISGVNLPAQTVINDLYVTLQIALNSSVITIPSEYLTYTPTTFTITINNWQNVYPNSLYLYYTDIYANTVTSQTVSITNNLDTTATFTFNKTINTRPGIKIAVSDSNVYGDGYLETGLLTINNSIGPINANLTTNNYAIFGKSTVYNIVLTNWNTSYFDIDGISSLSVILQQNTTIIPINTFTINTNPNYYLNFSNTFALGLFPVGVYKLRVVNNPNILQDVCDFNYGNQISVTVNNTIPISFLTYASTQFNCTVNNWYSTFYPSQLNVNILTVFNNANTTSLITINNDGTFTFTHTENTLPGIKLALSDQARYGTGYIESPQLLIRDKIGEVNPSKTIDNIIQNKTKNIIITLNQWNTSYASTTQLYVYIGSLSTVLESYGLFNIFLDTDSLYKISCSITPTHTLGTYDMYITDTDPTNPVYVIRQVLTSQINIINEISINVDSTVPITFETYTSTQFNCSINNWYPLDYPNELYLTITKTFDNTTTTSLVTINTDSTFTFTHTENTLPGIKIALSDNITYGSGYVESDQVTITDIIGPVNASKTIDHIIQNKPKTIIITLNNWNDSYASISDLYVYIYDTTILESYGSFTIFLDTDSKYKISCSITPTHTIGTYDMYISDTDPTNLTYAIRQILTSQINIINNISINVDSIIPAPFTVNVFTQFNCSVNNWYPLEYPDELYLKIIILSNNTSSTSLVTINSDSTFSFTDTVSTTPGIKISLSDNITYGSGYIESAQVTISNDTNPEEPSIIVGSENNKNLFTYSTDLNTWYNSRSDTLNAPINNIIYNGSMWLVSTQNGLYYSTNNTTLNRTNADNLLTKGIVNDFAWNGTKWIAVGISNNNSAIITSTDGITWSTVINDFFKTKASSVIWNSNLSKWYVGGSNYKSLYLASIYLYSYDGIIWNYKSNNTTNSFITQALKYNGSMWLAGGFDDSTLNTLLYSYDGFNWNIVTNSDTFFINCANLSWNGKLWLASCNSENTGYLSTIMYSTDGLNWLPSSNADTIFGPTIEISYNDIMWVAGGSALLGFNSLGYSTDGITWTASTNGNSIFSQVGQAIAWNGDIWVAGGQGINSLAYSIDGMTWIASSNGNTIFTGCTNVAWNGNMWVAGGYGTNCLAYSNNGITWIAAPNSNNSNTIFNILWNDNMWSASGITTNNQNLLLYSYDGIYWTTSINKTANTNIILAVGQNSDGTTMAYSNDNINDFMNWTPITHTFATSIANATFNGNIWVATGYKNGVGGVIITSPDGINWTDTNTTMFGNSAIGAIEYNSNMWVAGSSFNNSGYLGYSYDGINWTDSGCTFYLNGGVSQIVWNEKIWLAIGQMTNTVNSFAYSYDGINWINTNDTLFAFQNGVTLAWNGSLWVAGGSGNTTSLGYSYDGITWYPANNQLFLGNASGVLTLAWNSTIWVGGGSNTNRSNGSLLWSNDGITWTKSTTSIYEGGQVQKVIWTGSNFIAMGYIVSPNTINIISISTDGKIWSLIDSSSLTNQGYDITYGRIVSFGISASCMGVNGTLKDLSSNSATIISSSNGTTWTRQVDDVLNDNFLLACGRDSLNDTSMAYSYDNINWISITHTIFPGGVATARWNGNIWVAVGSNGSIGTIATSTNGIDWANTNTTAFGSTPAIIGLNYNDHMWVAGSAFNNESYIGYSYDGINWYNTNTTYLLSGVISDIKWNGTLWLAATNINDFAYSYDGINWTATNSNIFSGGAAYAMEWNGLMWVGIGTNSNTTVGYSYDGINWNPATNQVMTGNTATSVAWNGSIWVVGGVNGPRTIQLIWSTDGMNWTNSGTTIFDGGQVQRVHWTGFKFIALGCGTNSNITLYASSVDGKNWSQFYPNLDTLDLNVFNGDIVSKINKYDTTTCTSLLNNNSITIAGRSNSSSSNLIYTNNNITWNDVTNGGNSIFSSICNKIVYNNTDYLALGNGINSIAYSSDGINWTPSPNSIFAKGAKSGVWDVTKWIVVGSDKIASSTDNINWNSNTKQSISVAGGSGTNNLVYSFDGINWLPSPTIVDPLNPVLSIGYNGTIWVAGIQTIGMFYSNDGINWNIADSGSDILTYPRKIAWGDSMWYVMGYGGLQNGGITSTDGINWVVAAGSPSTSDQVFSIAYGNNLWVAGTYGDPNAGNALQYSTDTVTWYNADYFDTNTGTYILPGRCNISLWNGNMWVAGGGSVYGNAGTGAIAYSSDGITWLRGTGISTMFSNCFALGWNGNIWVAGGEKITNTLAYSNDGIDWLPSANGSSILQFICNGVEWNGEIWIASGGSNSLAYSYDGINWFTSPNGNSVLTSGGNSVKWNENPSSNSHIIVAGGSGENNFIYSYNGISWLPSPTIIDATNSVLSIEYNGNIWVAGIELLGMFYSNDGINWNIAESGGDLLLYPRKIAWDGYMWYAIGFSGTANPGATSTDGINWVEAAGYPIYSDQAFSIAYGNNLWVAGTYGIASYTLQYSTDAITWYLANFTNGDPITDISGFYINGGCTVIKWNGTIWLAGGFGSSILNSEGIIHSYNGIDWFPNVGIRNIFNVCLALGWNGTMWVAGGSKNSETLAYSYDGINWSASANGSSILLSTCKSVDWNGSKWVAGGDTGSSTLAYSIDGITWTASTIGNSLLTTTASALHANLNIINYSNVIINESIPSFIDGSYLLYREQIMKSSVLNIKPNKIMKSSVLNIKLNEIMNLLELPSKLFINEHAPFNIKLHNWLLIVHSLNIYSKKLYSFLISIGLTSNDTNPKFVYVTNLINIDNLYYLNIPPLQNIHNKFIYISIIVNKQIITFPPILMNKTTLLLKNATSNFKLKNRDEMYTFNVTGKALKLYVYTNNLDLVAQVPVVNNQIKFSYNSDLDNIYFKISSGEHFTGITSITDLIYLIDKNIINVKLDTYDINTNKRNILLDNWVISDIKNINIVSNNYNKILEISSFTPNNIQNCKLWLDAYDINSLNLENDNIQSWFDKSNNNNHAQASKVYPGYNMKYNCVYFNKDSYFTLPDNTIPLNNTNYHVFMVLTPQNTKNVYNFIMGTLDNITKPTENEINTFLLDNNTYNNSWKNNDIISTEYESNTIQLVSFEYILNNKRNIYVNSNIVQVNNISNTSNSSNSSNSSKNNLIGGIINKFTYIGGIHEIVIYNSIMTISDKKQIDNYLLNKWNIKK